MGRSAELSVANAFTTRVESDGSTRAGGQAHGRRASHACLSGPDRASWLGDVSESRTQRTHSTLAKRLHCERP